MKIFKNNLVLILAIILTVFAVLPILAPIFAYLKLNFLSDPIYWVYQWFCHQRPWRSYHLFDYQLAVDARDLFIFLSLAIGAFSVHFKKIKPAKFMYALLISGVFTIPLAIDGIVQMIAEINAVNGTLPFYESTNLIRSVTGTLMGTGISFAFFPMLNLKIRQVNSLKESLKTFSLSIVVTLLFIPLIVLGWSLTSTKYKPSSSIIDHVQRYPGFNYEITFEGAHSTIVRVIKLPPNNFIERAKKLNREDLIDKYIAN